MWTQACLNTGGFGLSWFLVSLKDTSLGYFAAHYFHSLLS